ncbi:TIM-barrel domain-containing protein [Reichenbachiella versicolor]|uniref:TIM-barrel domain-containing protein n=1 Tax=Reichenbachiella versicolor TaxID=1821036 RepID=UPI000D6E26EE|nr:TIM-barrel domain-containing protein [Reichenbachiella versicolor]
MSQFDFVQVNEFQPNSNTGWNQIGAITDYSFEGNDLLLVNEAGYQIKISFLSDTAMRVRFKPVVDPDYSGQESYAVVDRNLGSVSIEYTYLNDNGGTLHITTGKLDVFIGLAPYGISVQKDGKVITEDTYGKNLIFSNEAVANLKKAPLNESYFGFGEKAGSMLDKKEYTMTFFNYDNFSYDDPGVVPPGNAGGPLNPSGPLYNSMPYCLAIGKGDSGIEYAYGIYLDNVSQTYFNMGSNDYSNMDGKYYFGALYGELDYYIMVGSDTDGSINEVASVITQYSKLTGASAMPPMYALGFQQGCYGYYDKWKLEKIAEEYREAKIPIDGLHIDVDFQNNYRTFTNSEVKFPDVEEMFDKLHKMGFKCSTNITGIITANPYDEDGKLPGEKGYVPYPTRDNLVELDVTNAMESKYHDDTVTATTDDGDGAEKPYPQAFIWNTRYDDGESDKIFMAQEGYGTDTEYNGKPYNPYVRNYPSPGYPEGQLTLGTYGYYMDMGIQSVKEYWGAQYQYLLSKGLDMIWQDMTCPALIPNVDNNTAVKSLPLDLQMYDKVTGSYQPNAKIHNSFSLNLVKATFEGLTNLRENEEAVGSYNYKKRNFIISRGGFAGVHRYAGIWTGDSASSWDFLKINIPEVLNVGLSGLPISGCDIGGFATGSGSVTQGGTHNVTQYELFTRWMTAGAFLPWYRNHYDGYNKSFQEPFKYGDPVPDNCKKYIEMRYQLLQVFYDLMYENTQNGLPVCRALFLNEPNDVKVFDYADQQFFLGKDILVAPVTDENWYKEVYVPKDSNWFVFDLSGKLNRPTEGGQAYQWYVPLDLVPVYIREGAIIPIRQLTLFVDAEKANYLDFFIYPGQDSTYELYQDDKISTAFEEGAYRTTAIAANNTETGKTVTFNRTYESKLYTPLEEYFFVSFLGVNAEPAMLSVNGKKLKIKTQEEVEKSKSNAYYFDSVDQKVVVKVFDNASQITVDIDHLFDYTFEKIELPTAELV